MGNKQAAFSDEQLEAYQDCTFFTRKEILQVFKRFRELSPDTFPKHHAHAHAAGASTSSNPNRTAVINPAAWWASNVKVPRRAIEAMPEFKENPFRRRICEVFSESGAGSMCFDDFLDMFSVLSEAAPRDIKAVYAFRIYDFDGDGTLGKLDLQRTVNCLTRRELTAEEVDFICEKVLEEADLDDDGSLSFSEFEHVISRAPDFISTFHVRI